MTYPLSFPYSLRVRVISERNSDAQTESQHSERHSQLCTHTVNNKSEINLIHFEIYDFYLLRFVQIRNTTVRNVTTSYQRPFRSAFPFVQTVVDRIPVC